jgi:c-di-GMP-binding flagellar brake protein YcgR
MENVNETSENGFGGKLLGISVPSLLQMVESEQKNCTLRVTYQEKKGYLYIKDGELIAAETDSLSKENAVYEIISWDKPVIEIKDTIPVKEKEIFQPLMSVLMEGFRLRDEKLSDTQPAATDRLKLPKLKSQVTAGRRIGLDIGAKLQIEIEDFGSPLESIMVGMMPDDYLIITLPSHLSLNGHGLSKGAHFDIKYLYLGKVCFFHSKLMASVDFHQKLLFVSYPLVIHYHELRRHRRVAIFLPCTIGLDDGQSYPAVLLDMSVSGCLCQQKSKEDKPIPLPSFHIDEKLTIRCLLPGMDEEQELTGHIRNLNKTKRETRIGVEFVENPPAVEKAITHYLSY